MICTPCADATDSISAAVRAGEIEPTGHHPEICRDHGGEPAGCGCQHRPVREQHAEPRGTHPDA